MATDKEQGDLAAPPQAASALRAAARGRPTTPSPVITAPHHPRPAQTPLGQAEPTPGSHTCPTPRLRRLEAWLSSRALLLLAVVVLLTFNTGLVLNLTRTHAEALDSARSTLSSMRQAVRGHAEATIARINVVLADTSELLALHPQGLTRGDPAVHAFLARQSDLLDTARALIVTDAQGRLLHDSAMLPPMVLDLSDRDYFQLHSRNPAAGFFIGAPVRGRTTGRWFISMSRAVYDAQGTFAGVIVAIVDPTHLNDAYADMRLSHKGAITLYRADGTVLLRAPDFEHFIGTDQKSRPLFTELLPQGNEGLVDARTGLDGQERLMAWGRSAQWPLVVTVSASRDAILASWRQGLPYHLAGMAAVSLVVLALVWQVWRQIRALGGLVGDLSQRERDLVAAHQASELANRAKTQFLANMSHELRTPLNAVIGFSDMLVSGTAGALSPQQRDYARDIHLSAMHLLDLINDILDVSKIESGTYDLHESPVNLSEVARISERMLRAKAKDKSITVDTVCLDDQAWVLADDRAMRQIVLNLLSNAIKFTPDGGQVTVAIGLEDRGSMTIQVTDTGIGIPEEHLELVLQPFHQVDSSDTRRHEGTGLGLPLAKALVEHHGGSLKLHSQPGRGTRVLVSLPPNRVLDRGSIAPDDSEAAPPPADPPQGTPEPPQGAPEPRSAGAPDASPRESQSVARNTGPGAAL